MRAAAIPARVVTGYQGGAPNSVDGVWTLRQRDAHAWTEVWLAERGWVRVDPTAAVAPGRLDRLAAEAGADGFAQVLGGFDGGLATRLRATWEAVNDRWNQWVLNYTQERQFDLLRRLGIDDPDWRSLGRILAGLAGAALLAGLAWQGLRHRQRDPWLRLYGAARAQLARRGLSSSEAVAPRTLARHVLARYGDPGQPVSDWLLRLEARRYGRAAGDARADDGDLAALRRELRRLPWPERPLPRWRAARRAALSSR